MLLKRIMKSSTTRFSITQRPYLQVKYLQELSLEMIAILIKFIQLVKENSCDNKSLMEGGEKTYCTPNLEYVQNGFKNMRSGWGVFSKSITICINGKQISVYTFLGGVRWRYETATSELGHFALNSYERLLEVLVLTSSSNRLSNVNFSLSKKVVYKPHKRCSTFTVSAPLFNK